MNKKDATNLSGVAESRTALICRIAAVAVAANFFFIGLAGLSLYRSKQRYDEAATVFGRDMALVLAQQVDETIGKVNLTLLTVADEVERRIADGTVDPKALNALIVRQAAHVQVLDGLRVTDASGASLYGTDITSCLGTSVADRSYYGGLHDNPRAGLVISEPLVCRVTRKWSLILARRISRPDGSFGGVVYGTIALSRFNEDFSTLDVGPHGSVSLRNAQLQIIARFPAPAYTRTNAAAPPANMLNAIRLQGFAGHYRASGTEIDRLYSFRRTATSNLYVNVGLAPVDYLAAWRGEVARLSGLVTVFVLGSFLGSLMFYRNALRRTAALRALARQGRLQQLLMEISSTYINLPLEGVDSAVHASMGEMAGFVGAERAYIFGLDGSRDLPACIHEWHAAAGGELNDSPPPSLPALLGADLLRRPVYIPDVASLPEGELREALERQGVRSMLAVPIMTDGRCAGLLGFDSIRAKRSWSGDERRLLTVFAQMLANVWKRRSSEEHLMQTNRHLARADAAKGEFLANMSHEIRTPMNGVLGMIDLLRHTGLTGEQSQYVDTASASGEILLTVLNDILDFSKIEAGKLDLESISFDLPGFVDDFIGIMAVRARDKNLVLACCASPEVPRNLRGDPVRLRQILMNLTDNAVKFTSRGDVIVRIGVEEETPDDVLLRFTVSDTGIGIPEDKIGLLFTKFSQVDSSTTRQFGGTGLGLAISKQLVLLMGGDIGVRSELGKGSEFRFSVRLGKEPALESRDAPAMAELKGARVLVVNGHPVNREILRNFLQSWGMRVEETADWNSSVKAISQAEAAHDPFAIAILDSRTQGADGQSFGEGDGPLPSGVRWVLLTSLGETGGDKWRRMGGTAATLTKPLRRQEVLQVVLDILVGRDHFILPQGAPKGVTELASGARILVVEDNGVNQQLLVKILGRLGLAAEVASNGIEALKALETSPYDLVLMDVQMPEMDGFRATEIIRDPKSRVRDHHVPVIAMTAHAMQGNREECLRVGMDDYVSKPIKVPALVAALEKWLDPGRKAGAARTPANSGA